ncbi:MAG: hypothetical protein R3195_03440 [Gemmatimonadota bacterium]|nr:hypothetical protein [Gemmatimonadota bacterium]
MSLPMTAGSVVIAGAVARRPRRGGHAWAFLQYVLGFRRLGWDVTWLDSIDPTTRSGATDDEDDYPRARRRRAAEVGEFERFCAFAGIEGDASLMVGASERRPPVDADAVAAGLPRRDVLERVRASDLLINVMGYIRDEEVLGAAPRRLFLDIDPGFGQMWEDMGLARLFHGHDAYATVGGRVGDDDCLIPTLGIDWIRTPPPVVLAEFEPRESRTDAPWTSVCSWRGPFEPIEHEGRTYGLRVHEFRRFLELPRLTDAPFTIALDIDESDAVDRDRLVAAGWRLVDPLDRAGDYESYRRFIRSSAGELMIAKGLYVQTRSGWFSDRSVCYLASGLPVVAQDTGWTESLPSGDGLIGFGTVGEAASAIDAVRSNPRRHARAAREVAEARFDSRRVLARLVERAVATPSMRASA